MRELFARTREVLEEDDDAAALEAVTDLREALDVHFAQEDELYHSTIAALRPEHAPALRACMDAHQDFRERLVRLVESVRAAPRDDARRVLAEIAEKFALHEEAEEGVLSAIDRESAALSR